MAGGYKRSMSQSRTRIGIVAPASRIPPELAGRINAIAAELYPGRAELVFHQQCFLKSGHFAGTDAERAEAFLDHANDPAFDAVWFARGGYGSGRIAAHVMENLKPAAREKLYLGYSDLGYMLAGLYKAGCKVAHGPMPADLNRSGRTSHGADSASCDAVDGKQAVVRALRYLVERAPDALEPHVSSNAPSAAFNITVLNHILGTALEPDLTGHVLMLEEVSEHHYRIDRSLHHITSFPSIRRIAGIRLGRCSEIPSNDPEFGQEEEEIAKHWCEVAGIAWLGRADIGHDIDNKVVPFGKR
jgi:muramoyltetrapeptide carboxypeptidase